MILVTGATGFIGKKIMESLDKMRIECEAFASDILDESSYKGYCREYTHIIHCAALIPHKEVYKANSITEVNVKGTALLQDYFAGVNFIYISTTDVTREALSDYAESKLLSEKLVLSSDSNTVIRLPSVFGPGYKQKKLIPMLIEEVVNNAPCEITSNDQREYLYIDSCVDKIIANLETKGVVTLQGIKIHNFDLRTLFYTIRDNKKAPCPIPGYEEFYNQILTTIQYKYPEFFGNCDILTRCDDAYRGTKATVEGNFMTNATIELIKPLVSGKDVLNLGLGNGKTSQVLDQHVKSQIVVEGSGEIIRSFSFPSGRTDFIESYFEDYSPSKKFDVILANHVLEHVDDPVHLMRHKFTRWIKSDGVIFVTVPNAKSLHRLVGKQMGLLKSEYDLNQSDINAGHQRVYDIDHLLADILAAGLKTEDFGGYNLKITSLNQMKDWSQDLLNAIFEVSKQMPPEICTNIWAKVRKND